MAYTGGLRYPLQPACSSRSAKARKLSQHASMMDFREPSFVNGYSEAVQTPVRVVSEPKLEPSYSNNVVGGSRRKVVGADGAPLAKRLRVAVDVDEVLGRFLHSLNKFCLEEYDLEYDISDYAQYDFASVWGCSLDEANHRVHDFFESRHFAVGILPIPGAYNSLQRLKETCDLVVVTSRQHIIQQPTLRWISQHFPETFSEVHFGNHWALSGTSRKKSEICSEIGATVLIDDNPRYAEDCAKAGMQVLLYDWMLSYPWAKTAEGPQHPSICRVKDWDEVEAALELLAIKS